MRGTYFDTAGLWMIATGVYVQGPHNPAAAGCMAVAAVAFMVCGLLQGLQRSRQ